MEVVEEVKKEEGGPKEVIENKEGVKKEKKE